MQAGPVPQATRSISSHGGPTTPVGTFSDGSGDFDVSFSECLDKALPPPEPTKSAGTHKTSEDGHPKVAEESENPPDTKFVPDAPPLNLVALLSLVTSPEQSTTERSLGGSASEQAHPATGDIALAPRSTLESASAVEAALGFGKNTDDSTTVMSATQDDPASRVTKLRGSPRESADGLQPASGPAAAINDASLRRTRGNAETRAEQLATGFDSERRGLRTMAQPENGAEYTTARDALPPRGLHAAQSDSNSGSPSNQRRPAPWNTNNERIEPKDVAARHSAFGEGFSFAAPVQSLAALAAEGKGIASPAPDADRSPLLGVERDSIPANPAPIMSPSDAPEQVVKISSHPTRPEWRSEFLRGMQVLVTDRVQVAELQLNPANMGPVSVQITINEHQANIIFGASHDETRRAIEQALPQLRDLLNASGIQLDSASVGDQASRQPGNSPAAARTPRAEDAPAPPLRVPPARRSQHLLDTYA